MCVDERLKAIDYKSIALPAELQGRELINRIFSLISQLNQSIKELYLARSCCCSNSLVAQSRPFVTDKSVLKSLSIWDFKSASNFIKTNQIME